MIVQQGSKISKTNQLFDILDSHEDLLNFDSERLSPEFILDLVGVDNIGERKENTSLGKTRSEAQKELYQRATHPFKNESFKKIYSDPSYIEKQRVKKLKEKNPSWLGGIANYPYCYLFNEEFRERVRAFFGYICVECGSPQNGRRHCVHHVNYDKETCCHDGEPLFVCLCNKCNVKANGNKNEHSREWWQQHFTDMITNYYEGKCYFTKEEMKAYTGR